MNARTVWRFALSRGAIAGLVVALLSLLLHATLLSALVLGVAVLLCVCIVVMQSERRHTQLVNDLARTARAMVGDLSVRAEMHTGESMDALGNALDDLADELAQSMGQLQQEHDRLGAILEAMVEGVLVTGANGAILLANGALREMLIVGHDVVGKRPLEAIGDADLQDACDRAATTHKAVTLELSVGGLQPRRVLARVAPMHDARGGVVALLSDVTELRRLETMRRDFVANVSHELRTPVAAIAAATETLDCGALDQPDTAREFVLIIDRNTNRLRQLVEDLLQLSRIEAKKLNLMMEAVPLAPVIEHCIELFQLHAEKKSIALGHDISSKLPVAYVDRRALEQILSNLIDNAIKYCPERASVRVLARVGANGGVRLSVRDTGTGIEARHLPRLFERFYRVDPGRSRQEGGTGLGLAIVKHLAEAMRVEVHVESQVGVGTTFHVDLPTVPRVLEERVMET